MPIQDLINGGLGVFFMVKEAIDGSRRHREMASAARELAEKLPSESLTQTLAQMNPEQLEQVRRAKENLIEIMKADREVLAMMSEDQFEALVSRKMDETDLSREDAELLVKRDQGLLGRNRPVFSPPAQSPLTKAFEEAAAERIKEVLFPKGDGGGDKGKGPDLAETLKKAQDRGVQSLMLPDGTEISLNPKDTFGDELLQETLKWVKEKVPSLFKGEGEGGGLSKDLLASENPEIVKLGLEFRAKEEETKAAGIMAKSKSDATMSIAALAATIISPEGYAKVKGMLDLLRMGKGVQGETPQDQPPPTDDNFTKLPCLKCNHTNIVPIGAPKFTCEECGTEQEQDW